MFLEHQIRLSIQALTRKKWLGARKTLKLHRVRTPTHGIGISPTRRLKLALFL